MNKEQAYQELISDVKNYYTAQIIDPGKPVVLISSNYHMDRAVKTARSAGFTNIMRLPAPSSILNYGANVLSEVVLEVNDLTLRRN